FSVAWWPPCRQGKQPRFRASISPSFTRFDSRQSWRLAMRWCHASRAVVLAVLVAGGGALTPPHAGAQTPTFTVEGVITDEQQAVLPGATVTIHNVATNLSRTA